MGDNVNSNTKEYGEFINQLKDLSRTNEMAKEIVEKILKFQKRVEPLLNTIVVNTEYAKQKGDFAKEQGDFAFEQALNLKRCFYKNAAGEKCENKDKQKAYDANVKDEVATYTPQFNFEIKGACSNATYIKQGALITVIGAVKWSFEDQAVITNLPYWNFTNPFFGVCSKGFYAENTKNGVKIKKPKSYNGKEDVVNFKLTYINCNEKEIEWKNI